MRIGKWFKEWFKKQQEFDNKLSSEEAKEITTLLSCPADHQNTECSLVEQLRDKQKELKEFQDSGEQVVRLMPTITNDFCYGILLNLDEYNTCSDDVEYLEEKFMKAINNKKKLDKLRSEISELKQQLGIE